MTSSPQKTILITGASRGLGLSIATACAQAGYRVIGAARSYTDAFKTLENRFKNCVFFEKLDLEKTDTLHSWAKDIQTRYGALYGLINNAALAHDGVLATMHESEIIQSVTVNVTATIILTKYLIRPMLIARQGRIINIASIIATTGFNGLSVYGATKSALLGFTRSLAREVGRAHITVNALSPGYMETAMSAGINDDNMAKIRRRSPLGTLATVEDVAQASLYLLSENAQRITGIDWTIDAGSTI